MQPPFVKWERWTDTLATFLWPPLWTGPCWWHLPRRAVVRRNGVGGQVGTRPQRFRRVPCSLHMWPLHTSATPPVLASHFPVWTVDWPWSPA